MAASKRKAPAEQVAEIVETLDSGYDNSLVFDTETTGLLKPEVANLSEQPQIIEVGLLAFNRQYEVIGEWDILVNPGIELPAEITKITGLTNADLKDAPSFIEIIPTIAPIFRAADRVIAHNCNFDQTMLINELKRLGLEYQFPYPREWVCTVQVGWDTIFGRRAKMTELYETTMGKPLAQTHRALDDVKALFEIVKKQNW